MMTADELRLRIGEFARMLALNPKTIRYYEAIGLLQEPPRSASGYRLYGGADLDRLRFIVRAKTVGLSLNEIRQILDLRRSGEQPCGHVVALLEQHLAAVEKQLRVLQDVRAQLASLRDEAAAATPSDDCICGIIEHHAPPRSLAATVPVRAVPREP